MNSMRVQLFHAHTKKEAVEEGHVHIFIVYQHMESICTVVLHFKPKDFHSACAHTV